MPIYFAWFTTALLSVGGDANDQNLPQSGRLLYCVIIPVRNIYPNLSAGLVYHPVLDEQPVIDDSGSLLGFVGRDQFQPDGDVTVRLRSDFCAFALKGCEEIRIFPSVVLSFLPRKKLVRAGRHAAQDELSILVRCR